MIKLLIKILNSNKYILSSCDDDDELYYKLFLISRKKEISDILKVYPINAVILILYKYKFYNKVTYKSFQNVIDDNEYDNSKYYKIDFDCNEYEPFDLCSFPTYRIEYYVNNCNSNYEYLWFKILDEKFLKEEIKFNDDELKELNEYRLNNENAFIELNDDEYINLYNRPYTKIKIESNKINFYQNYVSCDKRRRIIPQKLYKNYKLTNFEYVDLNDEDSKNYYNFIIKK